MAKKSHKRKTATVSPYAPETGKPGGGKKWVIGVVFVVAAGLFYLFGATDVMMVADPRDAQQVALGKGVYGQQCAACHGANLEGQPNWRQKNPDGTLPAPPHDATGHTWHHGDQFLFDITKQGGAAKAPPGFKSAMPGFEAALDDTRIWAVLAYIKSRWPETVLARQRRINMRTN